MNVNRLQSFIGSKKAQGGEIPIFGRKMIFFAITAVILGLLGVGYILTTSAYAFKTTNMPKNLQREQYINRMFNYPGCFAYQDPNTQRVYPYWVDLDKFTDEQLQNCLQFPLTKTEVCYEIRLTRLAPAEDRLGLTEEPWRTVHSNNYNQRCIDGADITAIKKHVPVMENDQRSEGVVVILEIIKTT